MRPAEEKLQKDAIAFAKANKKRIAREMTDPQRFASEQNPVSVFMAGSPGAGKTEASIELLEKFKGSPILRIDPDELRSKFEGYDGTNAYLFQSAVSILVEKIHDLALKQSQSFILDGTLSNYSKAKENIERSLDKGRMVEILYVYQDPIQAWRFVLAREAAEGRRIMPEHFIDQYFAARDVVNRLKRKYEKSIHVDLLVKNIDNSHRLYKAGIDRIDSHIPEKYTAADIERLLGFV